MNRYRRDLVGHQAVYGPVDRGVMYLCQNCLEGWDDTLPPHRCPGELRATVEVIAPGEEPTGPIPKAPLHGRTITRPGDARRKRWAKNGSVR